MKYFSILILLFSFTAMAHDCGSQFRELRQFPDKVEVKNGGATAPILEMVNRSYMHYAMEVAQNTESVSHDGTKILIDGVKVKGYIVGINEKECDESHANYYFSAEGKMLAIDFVGSTEKTHFVCEK